MQAGPKDKLDSTAVSQPAIYVASLAALEKLKQDEGQVRAHTCMLLCGKALICSFVLPACLPSACTTAMHNQAKRNNTGGKVNLDS